MNQFNEYNISEEIIKALDILEYKEATAVQKNVIPKLLEYKNLLVKSQTGSGKTAAFGIPIVEHLDWEERKAQALILVPTRELALQIQSEIFNIGRYKRIKVEAIFGRSSFESQERNLRQMVHVIVATPGRLIDHIGRDTIDLSAVQTLIIDEADEMLAMGFIDQVQKVVKSVKGLKNIALFSATLPDEIVKLSKEIMKDSEHIEVENENVIEKRIQQDVYYVEQKDKLALIEDIITVENPDTSILFCNTKAMVEKVADFLWDLGIDVETLHGDMEQRDRTRVIQDFKINKFRYLVASDVAARGLDIDDVDIVFNVDIPENTNSYIHRIGRTARVDKEGKAISFVDSFTKKYLDIILEESNNQIEVKKGPSKSLVDDRKESFKAKIKRKTKIRKEKGHDFNVDIMKIHINAGKKTKLRPVDVVGAICSIDGVEKSDIGVISIVDLSTFVEILNGKGNMVLKALQEQTIKGRLRKVSKANPSEYERSIS